MKFLRWAAGIGAAFLFLGVCFWSMTNFLFPLVSFDSLRTVTVDIERVDVKPPMRGGRFVQITPKRSGTHLFIREAANFLDRGLDRFSTLRSGDSVVAWLAPDGSMPGDRNNVWQLRRGTEYLVEYSEMVDATKRARGWANLFSGLLATVGISLGVIGALGLNWSRFTRPHSSAV